MRLTGHTAPRDEAQELMWSAMRAIQDNEVEAAQLCRKALEIYPDCTDALTMLAEIETDLVCDYVEWMRKAVEAGRRDLGQKFFKENKGFFWELIETRPFMRAIAMLSEALIQWGKAEAVDEAIKIQEEMLELNPNDNHGVRDWLAGCYLARKRYKDTSALFERYPEDWLAAPAWARVLHAYATGNEERASELLTKARKRNAHVELYLTGRKRRPRIRTEMYSPGDHSEAVLCADMLWEAWKKHPKAKKWLKEVCNSDKIITSPVQTLDTTSTSAITACFQEPEPATAKETKNTGQGQFNELKFSNIESNRSDADMDGNTDRDLRELMGEVPAAYAPRLTDLVDLLDTFCDVHLNIEYRDLCREMAVSLCQKGSPVRKGKPKGWAAGIVYALGRINFLSDPSQTPHMKSKHIAEGLGVSVATMQAKARIISDGLGLTPMHPAWTLSSRMDDNPLVWMLEVDGFVIDVRMASREVQAAAHRKGLIPYIPADLDE